MNPPLPRIGVTLLLAASLACAGCGKMIKANSFGVGSQGMTWSDSINDPVPGIDRGSVQVVWLTHGPKPGVALAFWSDLPGERSRGSSDSRQAVFDSQLAGDGNIKVEYHCETTDGQEARITIDGSSFNSRLGALFLISTAEGKTRIRQVKFDAGAIPTDMQKFREFAKSRPDLADFFRKANGAPAKSE